jgi:glycosyltransferase involved in cell wall biosynthesis
LEVRKRHESDEPAGDYGLTLEVYIQNHTEEPLPRSVPSRFLQSYTKGITICIPAYNEEGTIEQVVKDAELALKQITVPREILIIDDCSTDHTWEILCKIQNTLPDLQIRRHSINRGIALTFAELYQWANKELVFLNSADGQWKMSTLLELLPMADQYDIVVARRRVKHYGYSRHLVSWLFNALPVIFFATPTYDAGSVKLVRRAIYDIPLISSGVFSEAERIIRAQRQGFRIGVKEVEHFPRRSGKALGASLSLTIEAVIDLLRCWFDMVILRRN